MNSQSERPLIELRKVCMDFAKPSGEPLPVLADIDLALRAREILGLLGRSGAGKSTLLRIAAGLVRPTSGQVYHRSMPLTGPSEGIAVVFQTFALFPWLTVIENVETGLDAFALTGRERRERAESAIDLIGLDGFQGAYPRELSGGMRQRVGFARAIVTGSSVLLMDEPFSALDVLTAETLRTDFIDLWQEQEIPTTSALLVTHNIEEAVLMCDRIAILSSNPGRVAAEIPVSLAHPRNRLDDAFRTVVDDIYALLTSRAVVFSAAPGQLHSGFARPLARASVSQMSGLLETLAGAPYHGRSGLREIARALGLQVDDLFPLAESLHMLGFAELSDGAVRLTPAGRMFVHGGTGERKRLFREHLLEFVPLSAHIRRVLEERGGHRAPRVRFESELEDHLTRRDVERTLRVVTGWARYAELFGYDDRTREFHI